MDFTSGHGGIDCDTPHLFIAGRMHSIPECGNATELVSKGLNLAMRRSWCISQLFRALLIEEPGMLIVTEKEEIVTVITIVHRMHACCA